jgi:hypothetical protein
MSNCWHILVPLAIPCQMNYISFENGTQPSSLFPLKCSRQQCTSDGINTYSQRLQTADEYWSLVIPIFPSFLVHFSSLSDTKPGILPLNKFAAQEEENRHLTYSEHFQLVSTQLYLYSTTKKGLLGCVEYLETFANPQFYKLSMIERYFLQRTSDDSPAMPTSDSIRTSAFSISVYKSKFGTSSSRLHGTK